MFRVHWKTNLRVINTTSWSGITSSLVYLINKVSRNFCRSFIAKNNLGEGISTLNQERRSRNAGTERNYPWCGKSALRRARKFGPTAITRDPRGFWDESATAGIRHVSSNMLERVEFAELPLPRSYRISGVARARAKTRLTLTPPPTLFTRKYVK